MVRRIQLSLIFLVSLTALSGLFGCGANGDSQELVNAIILEAELNDGSLIQELSIEGGETRIRSDETVQLIGVGTDINGEINNVSDRLTWSSAEPEYATVSQSGLVTGIAPKGTDQGFVEIRASSLNGVTASTEVSINDAAVVSIDIEQKSPANNTIYTCVDTQLSARLIYEDGMEQSVTSKADWQLAGSSSASINGDGLLRTSADENETIQLYATVYETTGNIELETTTEHLNTIFTYFNQQQVSSVSLAVGERLNIAAVATFNSGVPLDVENISHNANWKSNSQSILGVSNADVSKGTILGLSNGNTVLEVDCSGQKSFLTVAVTGDDEIETLSLVPATEVVTLSQGESYSLKMLSTFNGQTSATNVTEFTDWQLGSSNLLSGELREHGTNDTSYRVTTSSSEIGRTTLTASFASVSREISINVVE